MIGFQLEGKVAVVTGASMGIGRAIAKGLGEAGCTVVCASRNLEALEETAAAIRNAGGEAVVEYVDVLNVESIRTLADRVKARFGRVDILVNNAAWTVGKMAFDVTEEEWDRTIDSTLKSVFFACQIFGKIMADQGKGHIVNIGSNFGNVTFKTRSVYAAAKAGVHHLTRALALEWSPLGLRVNCVAPCITETETRKALLESPGYKEWVTTQMLPVGRWAQPEDIVGAVLFLCSPLADMVTGHVLNVDGGWTLH
ncbi:glucose 1-dehydrogenase [Thermaerobacter composti]|uniref:Glucose 1-dehydrogenase n=1 Tax=Thermaerobacter composti TaxID=554949 RepID=A0ABZ0QM17_9FIRM|nr:glucose 1-dehydrogenase [Thermaerobacter composti]WPD18535.1 glucose 1-dehydrogenase [Thermaerobacter composti]